MKNNGCTSNMPYERRNRQLMAWRQQLRSPRRLWSARLFQHLPPRRHRLEPFPPSRPLRHGRFRLPEPCPLSLFQACRDLPHYQLRQQRQSKPPGLACSVCPYRPRHPCHINHQAREPRRLQRGGAPSSFTKPPANRRIASCFAGTSRFPGSSTLAPFACVPIAGTFCL